MVDAPATPRFPSVPPRAGHYESFYLKACDPSDPVAVWIRYTIFKRPGAAPVGSVWFTFFDGSADGPQAVKVTLPGPRSAGGDYISVGESRFGPGAVVGSAAADQGCDAAWDL